MTLHLPDDAVRQINTALFAGRKIEAIKLYREFTGQGLKESKDFVEALEVELRTSSPEQFTSPPRKGCFGMAIIMILVSCALYCWM